MSAACSPLIRPSPSGLSGWPDVPRNF